jgi:cytochrome c peroxidase
MRKRIWLLGLLLSAAVCAAAPQEALQSYSAQAKQENPAFKEFSARAGETFYHAKHKPGGKEMSCATCHTDNPKSPGKHETTGKEIKPLAPAANPERFTDPAKIEKWFKRNCQDVLERVCTTQEKGDFITYLLSIK